MKRAYIPFAVFAVLLLGAAAFALPADDVVTHKQCARCGMDRENFDSSRMLVEYDDGTVAPLCSLRCAAVELADSLDRTPKSIKVADYNGKQLIDAEKAFWVVGGKKPGVMSGRGKWAFEKKDDAEAFMKANQGNLVSFDGALKAAYEDMADDMKMIRDKRHMMKTRMMEHKADAGH